MADTIKILPHQLGALIKKKVTSNKEAVKRGVRMGAERGAAYLASNKAEGPVDRGGFKNAWRVQNDSKGAKIVNDTPYAGIIERGARPHKVSVEGQEAIRGWIRRKVTSDPKEVENVLWGILNKLVTQGQQPTWLVRNNLDKLREFADKEINDALKQEAKKGLNE